MTPEQYERWQDFTRRMAGNAFPRNRRARREEAAAWVKQFIRRYEHDFEDVHGWDGEGRKVYLCDDMDGFLWDNGMIRRNERTGEETRTALGDMVSAIVRSGLDVAVKPSGGVIGFTIGDIRAMYPEGIPDWVAEFLPENHAEEPASTGLWL